MTIDFDRDLSNSFSGKDAGFVMESVERTVDFSALDSVLRKTSLSVKRKRGPNELEAIEVRARRKRDIDIMKERYSRGRFGGITGRVILDNINQPYNNGAANLKDFLVSNIPTVRFTGSGFVNTRNFSLGSGQNWAVPVFVDDIEATPSYMMSIRMDQVAFVKLYQAGQTLLGSDGAGGAIAVYLKSSDELAKAAPGWINSKKFHEVNGYGFARAFEPAEEDPGHTGWRTLLWDAEPELDDKGAWKASFEHWNAPRLRITIQGFDINGRLLHFEKLIDN